jgi:hypothetical protein
MTFLNSAALHMFASFDPEANDFFRFLIGARSDVAGSVSLENNYNGTNANRPRGNIFNSAGTQPNDNLSPITGRSQYLLQWTGSGAHQYFGRNVDLVNVGGSPTFSSADTTSFLVFAGVVSSVPARHSGQRIDAYSIGAAFTSATQRTAFHNAMSDFRTALSRT